MAAEFNIADLEHWDELILEKVAEYGLDCYPQEFEVCNHSQMLSYMAYSGMPSHYPHWSYGKSYEKTKTLYDYGVSGLPYEMVINSNPSLAYLMTDNSLLLQILTIAHVYGHNDFFKNNFTFKTTNADYTIQGFKLHADRIRSYIEDPSIGLSAVESILDAAQALSFQCRRNLAIAKTSRKSAEENLMQKEQGDIDPYHRIHKKKKTKKQDLHKIPIEPDEDLLLFIRDHNPFLAEWEKDVLTIVHQEAQYFIPQVETKIMNEGWASFWHREIVHSLDLPQELHLEFLVRHNQVIRPHPGGVNPYHVGLRLWDEILLADSDLNYGDRTPGQGIDKTSLARMFQVREVDRDVSFLRRFLTEELVRELNMFQHEEVGKERVITRVADSDDWSVIKESFLRSIGTGTLPVIRVVDADFKHNRSLYLEHCHDGRDLQLEYTEKTLAFVYRLWGRPVHLATRIDDEKKLLAFSDEGFELAGAN